NTDQAAASFRAALAITPAWLPAQLELAAAAIERGRTDEALTIYRGLMPQVPPARLIVARLLVGSISHRPPPRDWSPVEELLNQSPPEQRRTAAWRFTRNDLLLAQGKDAEA